MPEAKSLPPDEATARLLYQFSRRPSELEQMVDQGIELDEAVCQLTEALANGFYIPSFETVPMTLRGREVEYLAQWHLFVKGLCSDNYRALRHQRPELSREELNQLEDLQLLNGIRRGVHRAMVDNQRFMKTDK